MISVRPLLAILTFSVSIGIGCSTRVTPRSADADSSSVRADAGVDPKESPPPMADAGTVADAGTISLTRTGSNVIFGNDLLEVQFDGTSGLNTFKFSGQIL